MTKLRILKERIEKMSKHHQIEVLRIFSQIPGVCLNENNNGTFINLTEQNDDVITRLTDYIKYVDEQQKQLSSIENERERLEKVFFKDNKETSNIIIT